MNLPGSNLVWRLITGDPNLGEVASSYHDPTMVLLSVLVAVLAGFAALTIVDRMRVKNQNESGWWIWLGFGALTMGVGIWAMHFTGMIAYQTPVQVDYDLFLTIISVIPALLGGGVMIYYMNFDLHSMTIPHVTWAALLLAVGIGTMHYIGMEAMRMQAHLRYQAGLFVLSILVALVLALIAFYAKFLLTSDDESAAYTVDVATWGYRGVGAILIGFAVAGMHYTAMSATRLYPDESLVVEPGMGFAPEAMGFAIGGFTTLYLTGVIIAVQISKNLAVRDIIADQAEALAAGNFDAPVLQKDVGGRLGSAFQGMVSNFETAANQAKAISSGELNAPVLDETVRGAFGQSFQRMIEQLTQLIKKLKQTINQLDDISIEIRSTTDELLQSSQKLSASTETASETTEEGQEVVKEMSKTMDKINDASEEIQDAIEVIDDIASRTKLLSLNAAVEAAKAGEEGEGFAVVAEEVGQLAQQSMGAAETIHETIEESVDRTEVGAKKAQQSEQALRQIHEQIQDVSQQMRKISSNNHRDSSPGKTTSSDPSTSLENGEATSSVEQLTKQAESMEQLVDELSSSLEQFTLNQS
jgi:NO-binding membrane sensor protein with MHYT domain